MYHDWEVRGRKFLYFARLVLWSNTATGSAFDDSFIGVINFIGATSVALSTLVSITYQCFGSNYLKRQHLAGDYDIYIPWRVDDEDYLVHENYAWCRFGHLDF